MPLDLVARMMLQTTTLDQALARQDMLREALIRSPAMVRSSSRKCCRDYPRDLVDHVPLALARMPKRLRTRR